ncbi:MAG TPA: tetratricopeptide repeat protein, partial [Sediminispirochaeta sp.]|nr:tetratricopeptide repeat protein [Sediminispirochaeta sp.]
EEEIREPKDLEGLEEFDLGEDFALEEEPETEEFEEEAAPPEAESPEGAEGGEAESVEDVESLEGLEEFEDLEDLEEAQEEGPETSEEAEPIESLESGEETEEDFSLPDDLQMDDELFGEEELPDLGTGTGETEELEEAPEMEEGASEEGALPELEGEEDFELPDLEEMPAEGEEAEFSEDLEEGDEGFEVLGESDEGPDLDSGLEELELPEEEFEEGEFELDEFNLGDLGEEFGVLEEGEEKEEEPAASAETAPEGAEAEEVVEVELDDEQFDALRETLVTLPRNLKLIIEEQIGEKGLSGKGLKSIVDALVARKSPKEIAQITSKVIGRKIKIPSQYEKKSGAEFEAEKDTFAYALRYRILPMARTILISTLVVALLSFLSYRYIYQPLYALHLYNEGYEQLQQREYPVANDYFQQALRQKVMKDQFLRYAQGYREHDQWPLAREKYQQLLDYYPYDKEGTLEWAGMELRVLNNYEQSSSLLEDFLDENPKDYEALLLLGDTYLEWGREDYGKYEQARYSYAVLMESYGVEDEVLFRMLRYFVRTDNFEESLNIKKHYDRRPEVEVDPEAYAELGGYLLEKNRLDDVREVLFRAKEVNERLPEIHYQLARYFKRISEYREEEKALENVLALLRDEPTQSSQRLEMLVDSYRRYGERLFESQRYLEAQTNLERGIQHYERAKEHKLLEPKANLGKIYADLGDIYYYQGGDFDQAAELYDQAERNRYDSQEMKYKQGFISYRRGDYRRALQRFQRSAGSFSNNPNIMYATANTLYQRGNYHSAQGYYEHLREILERKLETEKPLLIDERRDHRALVENLVKVSNNLGVTYYNLHRQTGLVDPQSRAMVQFAESSRYFDRLSRVPETMERSALTNLGFVNQRNFLFPTRDFELQIYPDLPMDFESLEFGP